MTSQDVADYIDETLRTFRYDPPDVSSTIGVPWSVERVLAGVEDLRGSLLTAPREAVVRLTRDEASGGHDATLWIVAESSDGYFVFFDSGSRDFGLALADGDDHFKSLNVRGDLVGTFLAR